MGNAFQCDYCYEYTDRMLMVEEDVWKKISINKRDFVCPDCMEAKWGKPFTINEVKKNIPANIWWYDLNDIGFNEKIYISKSDYWEIAVSVFDTGYICLHYEDADGRTVTGFHKTEAIRLANAITDLVKSVDTKNKKSVE